MPVHPLAGQPAPVENLCDMDALLAKFWGARPNVANPAERVSFGTSGHRGSALRGSFQALHIAAITQAVVEFRKAAGINGPLFVARDSHGLSEPAQQVVLEVLAAHGVSVLYAGGMGADALVATPVCSHAILTYNKTASPGGFADGLIVTPSHNPPEDGGIKYNPPHGGPADTDVTRLIETRANELLAAPESIVRFSYEAAMASGCIHAFDFFTPYVDGLDTVLNMKAIADSKICLGADPLGGASLPLWHRIAERYGVNIHVVDARLDPTFGFMPLDHDGKTRMDCSSAYAMANLVRLVQGSSPYDLAFGNDADADRHGIVTKSRGLLNPNHYLCAAIDYLFRTRSFDPNIAIGKTAVSSALINRVATSLGRNVVEVPVGFKWFVQGLFDGSLGFGGEESAGASFLRKDASVWTTDKDGPLLCLLAAEMLATTGKDPGEHYQRLTEQLGAPSYTRVDSKTCAQEKATLAAIRPEELVGKTIGGDVVLQAFTKAPGNLAGLGGLKVETARGWFAARPSGTEDIMKLYAESFVDETHLAAIVADAQSLISPKS